MDIEALRIVMLVSQHRSFAAAARVMNVDPSSISRSVANVEAELGLRLFQRTTRSLALTEEGEIYLRRLAPLLQELERARDEAGRAREEPSGTLKMTASVAFAQKCILPHLGGFQNSYPDITLELMPTDSNLDIAAEGIDLAIRLAPAPKGDLISTRLMSTRYHVCASPDYVRREGHPENPKQLADCNCLRFALPEYRTRWRFRKSGKPAFDVPVSGKLVIANALSLRQAAIDGLGPALLADWLIDQDIRDGHLIDLFPDHECTATEFDTAAWALYPSRNYLPKKVRVMIDHLRATLAN